MEPTNTLDRLAERRAILRGFVSFDQNDASKFVVRLQLFTVVADTLVMVRHSCFVGEGTFGTFGEVFLHSCTAKAIEDLVTAWATPEDIASPHYVCDKETVIVFREGMYETSGVPRVTENLTDMRLLQALPTLLGFFRQKVEEKDGPFADNRNPKGQHIAWGAFSRFVGLLNRQNREYAEALAKLRTPV